jgi:cell division protein FtsL
VSRRANERAERSERAAPSLGPIGTSVAIALPVVMAALFYVWTNVTTVQLGYELSEAAQAHRVLLEENRGLRVEVAALKAPDRLARLAKIHHELAPPQTEQVIEVE